MDAADTPISSDEQAEFEALKAQSLRHIDEMCRHINYIGALRLDVHEHYDKYVASLGEDDARKLDITVTDAFDGIFDKLNELGVAAGLPPFPQRIPSHRPKETLNEASESQPRRPPHQGDEEP